jgi:hypothetical protein
MKSNLPWEIDEIWGTTRINGHKHFYISIGNSNQPVDDYQGYGVAVCILPKENDTPTDRKIVEANAAYIVEACNNYERLQTEKAELAKACEQMIAVTMYQLGKMEPTNDEVMAAVNFTKAALAKVQP